MPRIGSKQELDEITALAASTKDYVSNQDSVQYLNSPHLTCDKTFKTVQNKDNLNQTAHIQISRVCNRLTSSRKI